MTQQKTVEVQTRGRGLYLITDQILDGLELPTTGLLNVFIQHTSASLLIQENADPTARADIEEFINRLVPESDTWYTHDAEGPDDSTSHLKSSITQVALTVPIVGGRLALGTWQGIYLWEHRHAAHRRKVIVTVL
jgi:secondary thiamine-phosphate synthase enzyme